MRWTYSQGTGELRDPAGRLMHVGYSGKGPGRNNCDMQAVRQVGPIPRGHWVMGKPYDSRKVGAYAIPLKPSEGTETFGRSAFLIHGDNRTHDASEGCIIMPRRVRNAIVDSGVRVLEVVH
jgi:hypothetical protein